DIRALLFEQRRAVPCGEGVVILAKRLFAFFDDPFDPPAVADHGETDEGGVRGQRKGVHRLDRFRFGIVVVLLDGHRSVSTMALPFYSDGAQWDAISVGPP